MSKRRNKTQRIELLMEAVRILVALAIAYGIALLILFVISDEPLYVIQQFIIGPFTSARRIGSIINLAIPFTFCGLSMCFMYAVNKFNLIGDSIYMLAGCVMTWAALGLAQFNLPAWLMIIILLLVGAAVGVALAFIPAIMDRKFNANVVVVSLMLNSVIVQLTIWILRYVIKDNGIAYIGSKELPANAIVPRLFGHMRVEGALIFAIIATIIVALLFFKTPFGWKMRLTGTNPKFATAVGLPTLGISFAAQLAGGALAGIGGAAEIMSNYTRFQWTASPGYGFDGLLVAVLARKNPALVPFGALFLAYIRIGADVCNSSGDIPVEFVTVIQGIIILLVAAESFLSGMKNRMIFKQVEKDEKEKAQLTTAPAAAAAVSADASASNVSINAVSSETDTLKQDEQPIPPDKPDNDDGKKEGDQV